MDHEKWLPVVGFAGKYEVSDLGRVKVVSGRNYGMIKRQQLLKNYQRVKLWLNGKQTKPYVHHLVLNAFHGLRGPGQQCRHLDGDRGNNGAKNLKWGTAKENMADRLAHGTHQLGERNSLSKLTEEAVLDIRARYKWGNGKDLAVEYGVSGCTISAVVTGHTWSHLP